MVSRKKERMMVPGVGIEPTTLSSSGLRSTTELPRRLENSASMVPLLKILSTNTVINTAIRQALHETV